MEVVQMNKERIIELKVKPRFDIGARLWWEEINNVTGQTKATKVVVIGYRITTIVRPIYNDVSLNYLVVKAQDDQKEIDVHKYPKGFLFMNPDLFKGLMLQEGELFNSEAEVPGLRLN